MIELQNVCYKIDNKYILKNINLQLVEKKIGIIGANGSGKSTFAKLLNGLKLPTEGTVIIDGLHTCKCGREIRRKVGFIFQNPDNQIVFPIVEEDLAFGLKNIGYNKVDIDRKIDSLLSLYNMECLRKSSAHLLSDGEKQLLAIVGVVIMDPEYIIFDEPTTFLDLKNKKKIFQVMENLSQTAIVISHDLEFLSNFDRVIVFEQGKVVADGHPSVAIATYKKMMI
ncbi:energy-coupling factor ABC transporter ATP-binding protein [Cardinium endosymbiont of Culicoides punctatus]|uniref:energy-coupling factor ABC transporter ATP-binding protein n=1 Tax=Cardinium endosymbiont of Culicoides punctatus TaxID=2304601 RepID=UPI0010586BC9|nr:ATP-binding cassette domain-containing protein [Cardinium endosymbiont of Culicoides punctatus]TDG94182.1 Biotin transport ATP-binding protein BioM [Cardinium endosymbiont of Culicoides punctatus]